MTDIASIDEPLGGLPLGERVLYQDARLDLAVLEVRFSAATEPISDHQAEAFREVLQQNGFYADRVVPASQSEFRVDVSQGNQIASVTETHGWEYRRSDDQAVMFWPTSIAVQAGRGYERWSTSLKPPLSAALGAVQALLGPAMVQRTGVRYINRLPHRTDSEAAWEGRIDPSLLGPMHHPVLGSSIRGAQQQLDLDLGAGYGASIRHGIQPSDNLASDYLLDIDVFDLTTAAFAIESILFIAQRLNRTAMAIFQQCVTKKLHDEMQPATDSRGE